MGIGFWAIVAIAGFGASREAERPKSIVLEAIFVAAIAMTVRSSMLGIYRHEDTLILRSWFRTYKMDGEFVVGCGYSNYNGLLSKATPSRFFGMLTIDTGPQQIAFRFTVAPSAQVKRLAASVNKELRLPGEGQAELPL